ncbi:hypothetical protein NEOKW01_1253 [Nematocida sp. AWRm80]|nr:hypothetical protein NEOKW01_1253 [Nematocida sp. AWRm80]
MHSEYEKERDKLESKSGKGSEAEKRNIHASISEAESIDLYTLQPEVLAKELTATEVKILLDVSPVEILKFDPSKETNISAPTLSGYIKFTKGLSLHVATVILESVSKKEPSEIVAVKTNVSDSPYLTYQKHWVDVLKHLSKLNNLNSVCAVAAGIQKTNPNRVLKEEILSIKTDLENKINSETEPTLQKNNVLYIRDIHSIEKHLIDASENKQDSSSSKKFKRIIEYLNHIRSHSKIEVDKRINHAIISSAMESKDTRMREIEENELGYEGCFLFMDHSNYVPPE